jgi:hypothetical protein
MNRDINNQNKDKIKGAGACFISVFMIIACAGCLESDNGGHENSPVEEFDNPPSISNFSVTVDTTGNIIIGADISDDNLVESHATSLVDPGFTNQSGEKYWIIRYGPLEEVNMQTYNSYTNLQNGDFYTPCGSLFCYLGTNIYFDWQIMHIKASCDTPSGKINCWAEIDTLDMTHTIIDENGHPLIGILFFYPVALYSDLSEHNITEEVVSGKIRAPELKFTRFSHHSGKRIWAGIEATDSANQTSMKGQEFTYQY